jgi:thioredoxin-like negative regulator of GroEL
MRATLEDARLARYAGRFVWLELDYDKPVNQPVIARLGASMTPTLFVLDPRTEKPVATQLGGLTLGELKAFLDHGSQSDAPARSWDAWLQRDWRTCADIAVAEAPRMPRNAAFSRLVLSGLSCANAESSAAALKVLEPLAVEAVALPSTLRDHRFQLYQRLMYIAGKRGDNAAVNRWGDRWLAELDATKPSTDDERSALDIARVDAASVMHAPQRILPALQASERAMPRNYNASLRLAQTLVDAKRYDDADAACDRGIAHVTGPLGRSWLLQVKADALQGKGDAKGARAALEEALKAAREIGSPRSRDSNVAAIERALSAPRTATR